MPHDVFISHVEEDADLAVGLASELELAGFTTWYYERDTLRGPSYLLQVADAIGDASVVLVVISTHALSSHQVTAEVVRAYEREKPFVPLLVDISHAEYCHDVRYRCRCTRNRSDRRLKFERRAEAVKCGLGYRRRRAPKAKATSSGPRDARYRRAGNGVYIVHVPPYRVAHQMPNDARVTVNQTAPGRRRL